MFKHLNLENIIFLNIIIHQKPDKVITDPIFSAKSFESQFVLFTESHVTL